MREHTIALSFAELLDICEASSLVDEVLLLTGDFLGLLFQDETTVEHWNAFIPLAVTIS